MDGSTDQTRTRLPEPDDVRLARSVMERHYREPVRPVSHYCERLALYPEALDIAIAEHNPEMGGVCGPFGSKEQAIVVRDGLRELAHWAIKSNLLARLLYADEPLRTERCPEHKGRWSGCHLEPCPHGCNDGSNLTGWIDQSSEQSANAPASAATNQES